MPGSRKKGTTGKKSVFRQLLIMGLVLLLALLAAFVLTDRQMRMAWSRNVLNTNDQLMAQVEGKMEEYDQLMTQIATVTAYSPTIYTYFFQDPLERVVSNEDVNMVFSNTILLEHNISGIYMFDQEMSLIASMGKGLQKAKNMGVIRIRKSVMDYSSLFSFQDSSSSYYAIYFPVFNLQSQVYGQQIGMCVLVMRPQKFLDILEGAQATEHTQVYLLDGNNQVLAAQGGQWQKRLDPGWLETSKDYQVKCKNLSMGRWKLVTRIPKRELYGASGMDLRFHAGAYLLAFALLMCMIVFCYRRLARPIRELDQFVRLVAEHPQMRIQIKRQDEIGAVKERLNGMLDSMEKKNREIQDAREKAYKMEAAERQLQLLAYRNQINPHFLYNTLDCIRAMALYHDEDEIAEITMALAKVFRFAAKGGNIVKVEEEVNHIQEYASIIEHRFRGRISISIEAQKGVEGKPMIKFLMQPLIENAVFHGLEQKIGGGEVKASIFQEGSGRLGIQIEDNGCGIKKERLEEITAMLERGESQKGIGMANIYQRLKLFYGEEAIFSIESTPGVGTRIQIRIPDWVEEGNGADVSDLFSRR